MARRTYLPTMVFLLQQICTYVTKHRDKIIQTIGSGNAQYVDNFITACGALQDIAVPFLEEGV